MLTVSESLCHPWGTLNIPGGLSETESPMTVSECLCWRLVVLQANFDEEYELLCAMLLFSLLV